jgi:hypothetical protein
MRIARGKLTGDGLSSQVICRLQAFKYEFGLLWAGWVNPAEGHPHWHPTVLLDHRPLTLITEDGQELEILLKNEQGFFQAARATRYAAF